MANRKYDYNEDVRQPAEAVSEMVVYAGLVAITLATVSFIFYKWKH